MPRVKPASPMAEVMEDFGEQALSYAERKHDLERRGRLAAEIEIDLADHGPFGRFVEARRAEALAAFWVFVREADPTDAVAIAQIKAEIDGYIRARDHIIACMTDADQAAEIIQEEFGSQHDDQDQYRD